MAARPRRRVCAPRDQEESAFASILADLVARVPGARAAALVDRGGETVDYAGRGNPYAVRVAAAHFRLVLDEATAQRSLAAANSFVVRAARASFVVRLLADGYALVLCLSRGAGFRGLARAVPASVYRLAREAGWKQEATSWHAVDVLVDDHLRPCSLRIGGLEAPLEIFGRFRAALPRHERAWRVRVQTGIELTLVRESGGFWYSDEVVGLRRCRPSKNKSFDYLRPVTTVRRPTPDTTCLRRARGKTIPRVTGSSLWISCE